MSKTKLNNLIDKIVGKVGPLRVPAYWMNKLLKDISSTIISKIPTRVGQLANDKGYALSGDVYNKVEYIVTDPQDIRPIIDLKENVLTYVTVSDPMSSEAKPELRINMPMTFLAGKITRLGLVVNFTDAGSIRLDLPITWIGNNKKPAPEDFLGKTLVINLINYGDSYLYYGTWYVVEQDAYFTLVKGGPGQLTSASRSMNGISKILINDELYTNSYFPSYGLETGDKIQVFFRPEVENFKLMCDCDFLEVSKNIERLGSPSIYYFTDPGDIKLLKLHKNLKQIALYTTRSNDNPVIDTVEIEDVACFIQADFNDLTAQILSNSRIVCNGVDLVKSTMSVIPTGATRIGSYQFYYNYSPGPAVTIPDGVTEIAPNSFYFSQSGDVEMTIPASIKSLSIPAIQDKTATLSLRYNGSIDGFSTIEKTSQQPYRLFLGSSSSELQSINSRNILPKKAFYNCLSLKNLYISAPRIGLGAFAGCTNLESVIVYSILPDWEEGADIYPDTYPFVNCTGVLTTDTAPYDLFSNSQFSEVHLSASEIGNRAFYNSGKISKIVFNTTPSKIGSQAFYNISPEEIHILSIDDWLTIDFEDLGAHPICSNTKLCDLSGNLLEFAELHRSVIKQFALRSYKFITSVKIFSEEVQKDALRDSSVSSVEFSESLRIVGETAFYNCKNLKTVKFLSTPTIKSDAFALCSNVTFDFSEVREVPPLQNNTFNSTAVIVVPDALYDSWIISTNWSTYADQIIKKSDWDAQQTTE